MTKKRRYTIIYRWGDNGQIGAKHVYAEDPWKAFGVVAGNPPECAESVELLAAVPGWVMVSSPCEATEGNTCYLKDYPGYNPEHVNTEDAS